MGQRKIMIAMGERDALEACEICTKALPVGKRPELYTLEGKPICIQCGARIAPALVNILMADRADRPGIAGDPMGRG